MRIHLVVPHRPTREAKLIGPRAPSLDYARQAAYDWPMASAKASVDRKPTLVDEAEQALRRWFAPGRHRPGDRLPPEHELAGMLGVSRGTLRVALERLERGGEIVRRQGSGTFVGRVAGESAFSAGLELLESYSLLASRQGLDLSVSDMSISTESMNEDIAGELGLDPGTEAPMVERVLVADGRPAAHMRDWLHPELDLPPTDELEQALGRGNMVLDVLVDRDVPVAFARTDVMPRLLESGDPLAGALAVTPPIAVLELADTMHLASGDAVQHGISVFAPGRLALHVMRGLASSEPEQISAD
jgi:GntR family transcriptional regulator